MPLNEVFPEKVALLIVELSINQNNAYVESTSFYAFFQHIN